MEINSPQSFVPSCVPSSYRTENGLKKQKWQKRILPRKVGSQSDSWLPCFARLLKLVKLTPFSFYSVSCALFFSTPFNFRRYSPFSLLRWVAGLPPPNPLPHPFVRIASKILPLVKLCEAYCFLIYSYQYPRIFIFDFETSIETAFAFGCFPLCRHNICPARFVSFLAAGFTETSHGLTRALVVLWLGESVLVCV